MAECEQSCFDMVQSKDAFLQTDVCSCTRGDSSRVIAEEVWLAALAAIWHSCRLLEYENSV